jgi:hypothetical protein
MVAPIVVPHFSAVPVGLWDPEPPTTRIDGRVAWVDEVPAPDDALLPTGTQRYTYALDWSPSGILLLAVQGVPDPWWAWYKKGLDALATSARYVD